MTQFMTKELHDNGDGKQDIIIQIDGEEMIVIKENAYKAIGKTYEEMRNVNVMGATLIAFGHLLLEANKSKSNREEDNG